MLPDLPKEISDAIISSDADELGLVVRSHLHIEILLNEFLDLAVPHPKYLDEMNLTYADKVKLACALGLDSGFKPMLLALGTIRNKFSHNIGKEINSEMVKDLHSKVHPRTRESFPRIVNSLTDSGESISSFNECHPRDQFSSLVISLWIIMNGAIDELKEDIAL